MWDCAQTARYVFTWPAQLMPGDLDPSGELGGLIELGFAGSISPAISRLMAASAVLKQLYRGNKRPNALVFQKATYKRNGGRSVRFGRGCNCSMSTPDPGMMAMWSAAMPSESRASRSSGFCTSATFLSRMQRKRRRKTTNGLNSRALILSEMKVNPNPVKAFTSAVRRPIAASDPSTAACRAT